MVRKKTEDMSGRASQEPILNFLNARRPDDATFRPDETPADQFLHLKSFENYVGVMDRLIRECAGSL